jgi:hypothetical protein
MNERSSFGCCCFICSKFLCRFRWTVDNESTNINSSARRFSTTGSIPVEEFPK